MGALGALARARESLAEASTPMPHQQLFALLISAQEQSSDTQVSKTARKPGSAQNRLHPLQHVVVRPELVRSNAQALQGAG